MVSILDLDRKPRPVANLAAVLGVGMLGSQVAELLRTLLEPVSEHYRRAVVVWRGDAVQGVLSEEIDSTILSRENLDRVERECQVMGRGPGQAVELYLLFAFDPKEQDALSLLRPLLQDVSKLGITAHLLAIPIGNEYEDELVCCAQDVNRWSMVIPFPMKDRAAGNASAAEVVATAARTLLVLLAPGQPALQQARSPSRALAMRATAVCVDNEGEELIDRLARRAAARLLRSQFADPRPRSEPGAYDPERRARLCESVDLAGLVARLLANTPFLLETRGTTWRVALPGAYAAVELQGVARRRWVAVLRKLKHFFDFSRGRRWCEAMEDSAHRARTELGARFTEDLEALLRYRRGSDQVLAWCSLVRDRLDVPLEIAKPKDADFEKACGELEEKLRKDPESWAVGAHAALVTLLGAGVIRLAVQSRWGLVLGLGAMLPVLVVGTVATVRMLQRAHERLMRARDMAIAALSSHYEAQMSNNLLVAVEELRRTLTSQIVTVKQEIEKLGNAAKSQSEETAPRSTAGTGLSIEAIAPVVPHTLEEEYLEFLKLDWEQLLTHAAAKGHLIPCRPADNGQWVLPEETATLVARDWLRAKTRAPAAGEQFGFRKQLDPTYPDRLVRDLECHQGHFPVVSGGSITWFGSDEVLDQVESIIRKIDPNANRASLETGLLGCLRVARLNPDSGGAT